MVALNIITNISSMMIKLMLCSTRTKKSSLATLSKLGANHTKIEQYSDELCPLNLQFMN